MSKRDHPRIIIPFIDTDGMNGLDLRSTLDLNDKSRYITVMLDEDRIKVYGSNSKLDKTVEYQKVH